MASERSAVHAKQRWQAIVATQELIATSHGVVEPVEPLLVLGRCRFSNILFAPPFRFRLVRWLRLLFHQVAYVAAFQVLKGLLVSRDCSRFFWKLAPQELHAVEHLQIDLRRIKPAEQTVEARHETEIQLELPRIAR